jgi:hypothetical protein
MRIVGSVAGAAFALGLVAAASPADAADTFVVHGIDGRDLGLEPGLPVDIALNGACTFEGVAFEDVLGPADLEPGTYEVEVSLADAGSPCGGALAISGRIDVSVAETALVVAHLDQNGAPVLSKFTTNAAPLDPDEARLTVYHTAAAPGVDVRLNDDSGPVAVIKGLINGEASFPAEVPGGTYTALVSPSTPSGVGSTRRSPRSQST